MDIRLFRLAYAIEFLLALVAVFTLWSQVAGQGHLDIIDWHWKLALGLAAAFAAVKATAAGVEGEMPWNAGLRRWLLVTAAILCACGLVTYYYHLYYEPFEEEPQEEEPLQTSRAYKTSHDWDAFPPAAGGAFRVRPDHAGTADPLLHRADAGDGPEILDLAVRVSHQRKGIGRELIRLTQREGGPGTSIVLLAAPKAVEYYPHIGFERHHSAWVLRADQECRRK